CDPHEPSHRRARGVLLSRLAVVPPGAERAARAGERAGRGPGRAGRSRHRQRDTGPADADCPGPRDGGGAAAVYPDPYPRADTAAHGGAGLNLRRFGAYIVRRRRLPRSRNTRPDLTTRMPSIAHEYFELTKPRVVALIVFTAIIGMFLAVPGWPPLRQSVAGFLGIWPAAAAAAGLHHLIDPL